MDNTQKILNIAFEKGYITRIPEAPSQKEKLVKIILADYPREEFELEKQDTDELFYRNSISEHIENFPVPNEIEGKPPTLPMDITELSDKQLMYYHGAFNACAARASWLYTLAKAGETAAELLIDQYETKYIGTADRKDYGGKAKSHAVLKAEAHAKIPDIKKWKKIRNKHHIEAGNYRRLLDQFNNNCDRLSRQWTMRSEEREHS